MITGKPSSLGGSKPIVVEDLGDLFVTDAMVTQLENASDHARGSIVYDGSANGLVEIVKETKRAGIVSNTIERLGVRGVRAAPGVKVFNTCK